MLKSFFACLLGALSSWVFAGSAASHEPAASSIASLSHASAAEVGSGELLLQRAELHRVEGSYALAMADLVRAEAADPNLPDLDLCRGRLLRDRGRLEEAQTAFALQLQRDPGHIVARALRARTLVQLGRHEEAASEYGEAIERASAPSPELYLERAAAIDARGSEFVKGAIAALDAGIARLGAVVTLELRAAALEERLGDFDAAVQRIDRIAERASRKDHWDRRRAALLERARQRDAGDSR